MLVMRTTEDPAYPICKLVSSQKTVGLYHFPLAVYPFGFDGIEPRALLRKKAAYDPHSTPTLLDAAVVRTEPASEFTGDMPGSVVQMSSQTFLPRAWSFWAHQERNCVVMELTGLPSTNLNHVSPSSGGWIPSSRRELGLGIIVSDRPLDEAKRLALLGPAAQGGQSQPAPPALVQETHSPGGLGTGRSHFHQSVAPSFFLSYNGSGEVIHRLALSHLTPRRRAKVTRIVSPETRLCVSPSRKATSAAIASVHRLLSYPNSLGERCRNSRNRLALLSSKAARVRFEEPASKAPSPRLLKAWMAFLTVWEPHPKLAAILGGDSPRELARSIWLRRRTKTDLWSAAPLAEPGAPLATTNVRRLEVS